MKISLKTKFLVLILSCIVVANCILGSVYYILSNRSLVKSVNNTIDLMAKNAARRVYDMNEKEFGMLRALAAVTLFRESDISLSKKNEYLREIASLNNVRYENIAFYDEEGRSITASGDIIQKKDSPYFAGAITGKEVIVPPVFSDVGNAYYMFYSVPVYDYGMRPIGAIVSVVKGNHLAQLVSEIDLGYGAHPEIVDMNSGDIIANANGRVEDGLNNLSKYSSSADFKEIVKRILRGEHGIEIYKDDATKKDIIVSYRPVGKNCSWAVLCAAPYSDYMSDLYALNIALVSGLLITIVLVSIIGTIVVSLLIRPLFSVKKSITDIASGNADLTKRIDLNTRDEIGEVVQGFNQFTEKLQQIMGGLKQSKVALNTAGDDLEASTSDTSSSINEILSNINEVHVQINNQSDSVGQTAGAVNEIASNIESLERMIENQSQGVSQASSAVAQMIGNITSVNHSMDKMAKSFNELTDCTSMGSQLQSDVNEKIEAIKVQSETLLEANEAIASIAEQTNLLAMNAAIEAAHAGEAGKGFSVVADEIRKLSETSSQQSKTIGEHLFEIRQSIDGVVNASSQSSEAFQTITLKINETDELVRQIKAAMEEQNQGSQQINDALHSMNDSTLEVRTASKEMSEGNKAILEEVRNLQDATGVMKNKMDIMSDGARKISETGNALTEISDKMKQTILDMGEQIDQFKV